MRHKQFLFRKRNVVFALPLIAIICFLAIYSFSRSSEPRKIPSGNIRIVSLTPSLTQSIYYLGVQDKLIGCSTYCEPAMRDDVEVVGSVIKPNIEKIVSLKPDLVLVSDLVSKNDIETLMKFGVRVEIFLSPRSFEGICSDFIRLGKLVGKENEAARIVTESKARVQSLIIKTSQKKSKPKIFMQVGAFPIYAVIPDTFMDNYITYCGGLNIAQELTCGEVGREYVVSRNPDFIFIVTMGIAGEEEKQQWNQFKGMKAVVDKHVYIIDSKIACQPTPKSFIETLEILNEYIEE